MKQFGFNNSKMRRVFADSSVIIAGAASRKGASRAVLMMAEIGLFQVYEIKPNSYINIDDIIKPKS